MMKVALSASSERAVNAGMVLNRKPCKFMQLIRLGEEVYLTILTFTVTEVEDEALKGASFAIVVSGHKMH